MLDKLKEFPLADIINDEYSHLCGRGFSDKSYYQIPYIGEIIQETWQTTENANREKVIQEAVYRKEYEIYGYSRNEFIFLAQEGELREVEIPTIPVVEIAHQVVDYLYTMHISFINYDGEVVHSPIGRSIW